jgi:integrase
MPRKRQDSRLNTRNVRSTLKQRSEPYWRSISKGLALGYFKGAKGGTWIARHFNVATGRRKEALGVADDHMDADGINVLSFEQAQGRAHEWHKHLGQLDSGEVSAGAYTVAQAMDDYLSHSEAEKRKILTRTRLLIKAHIKPTLGRIQLNKLQHGKVKAWRDSLISNPPRVRTRPGKPQAFRTIDTSDPDVMRMRQATANRILTVLKAALNYAKSESRKVTTDAAWVDVKPFKKVDLPKVRFLTMDEVGMLTPACESDFQELVQGALLSGCRYGELTAMLVKAFDAGQGTVYVADSKNGESRYVELNDEGIAFFKRLTQDRDANETMFLRSNGKPWKHSEQQRPMDAACEAAKLQGVTFHILRHTYASHAVMNGMPIAVLSAQLGHKDTRITERHYAHLCQTYKQKLIRENAPSFGFAASKLGPVLVTKAS